MEDVCNCVQISKTRICIVRLPSLNLNEASKSKFCKLFQIRSAFVTSKALSELEMSFYAIRIFPFTWSQLNSTFDLVKLHFVFHDIWKLEIFVSPEQCEITKERS